VLVFLTDEADTFCLFFENYEVCAMLGFRVTISDIFDFSSFGRVEAAFSYETMC
jgi:hypothetical protein